MHSPDKPAVPHKQGFKSLFQNIAVNSLQRKRVESMPEIPVNQKRLIDSFCQLVAVDSGTGKERLLADELISRLKALGATVTEDHAGEAIGGNCGNLIAKLPGTKQGPTILLSAHMDRVEPGQGIKPIIENGVIRSSGETILAADDVAGIVEILEALTAAKEQNIPHVPVEIVFTIAEEGGLHGAKGLDVNQLEAEMGFIFDSSGPVGNITVQAPAQSTITAAFIGQAAHAGIAPEKGVNALKTAALAVANMNLGRIDEITTANIGVFQSGRATNIVPDRALIKGEVRSRDPQKLKEQVDHMLSCINNACKLTGATVDLKVEESYPAFHLTQKDEVVQAVIKACEACQLPVHLVGSGGGSDANILNGKGIPCVVLGTGFQDVHSVNEWIPVEQLVKGARLALGLLQVL